MLSELLILFTTALVVLVSLLIMASTSFVIVEYQNLRLYIPMTTLIAINIAVVSHVAQSRV